MSWIGWMVIVILGIIALDLCLIGGMIAVYEYERRREDCRRRRESPR